MTKKTLWGKIFGILGLAVVIFLTGFMANELIHVNGSQVPSDVNEVSSESIFDALDSYSTKERFSPGDHISEDNIHVYKDHIYIDIKDAGWGTFLDTNSMDPVLDNGHNSIEIKPNDTSDINVGDIIVYEHEDYGCIIHRVIETGLDNEGWYAIAKGDNNSVEDPWKIRFEQIEGIVVAIIY